MGIRERIKKLELIEKATEHRNAKHWWEFQLWERRLGIIGLYSEDLLTAEGLTIAKAYRRSFSANLPCAARKGEPLRETIDQNRKDRIKRLTEEFITDLDKTPEIKQYVKSFDTLKQDILTRIRKELNDATVREN